MDGAFCRRVSTVVSVWVRRVVLGRCGPPAVPPPNEKRLKRAKLFVSEMDKLKESGKNHCQKSVSENVYNLLRFCLEQDKTSVSVQEYLLGEEVVAMVTCMAEDTGDAGYVLVGMVSAFTMPDVGFPHIQAFGLNLVCTWLTPLVSTLAKPGFVLSLISFLDLCKNKARETCDKMSQCPTDLDLPIASLVKAALKTETKESINATLTKSSQTCLCYSIDNDWPEVARALLAHPDVDINGRPALGCTPLMTALRPSHFRFLLAKDILSNPHLNVAICDNEGKSAMDYCLTLVNMAEVKTEEIWMIILEILKHDSSPLELLQRSLDTLLQIKPVGDDAVHMRGEAISVISNSRKFCEAESSVPICVTFIKDKAANPEVDTTIPLALCQILHRPSLTTDTLISTFRILSAIRSSDQVLFTLITKCLIQIIKHPEFDVNDSLEEGTGFTAAHLSAHHRNHTILHCIIACDNFKPNTRDLVGNTVLFYIVVKFSPELICKLLASISGERSGTWRSKMMQMKRPLLTTDVVVARKRTKRSVTY